MNRQETQKNDHQQDNFAISAFSSFFLWGVCSALAITICTLIDALLVGNLVGNEGLAVVNLSTPLFLAFGLLGVTLGVGGNVLIGKQLGSSNVVQAQEAFHKLLWIGLVVGVACLALCAPLQTTICRLLGADDALLMVAQAYLAPVCYAAPLFVLYHLLSLSVRTDGDPKRAAIAAGVVIVVNLSLDVFFMQVLKIGIRGASLSLCIAEGLGVVILLTHFLEKHALLTLGIKRPTRQNIYEFVSNGFGVGSALLCQGMVMVCFNALLLQDSQYGVFNVAVFTVIYTTSLLPGAFFDGGGNALATVVAIFCGEKDRHSVLTVLRHATWTLSILGGLFGVALFLYSEQILMLFGLAVTDSAQMALRIFTFSLVLTGIHITMTAFWQAIGRSRLAGTFSVVRNLALMLVIGFVLIPRYQITGLALTYLVTECICFGGMLLVQFTRRSAAYMEQGFKTVHRTFERYYPIQTESMAQIAPDLEGICEEWEMSVKETFFINLIVEELLLNIIKFGLIGSSKPHYIAVKLLDNGGEYILRIRDNVKTYNPFESQGDEIDMGVIRLITTKSSYYDYQRKLIFNYLYIIL